ncbi:MAG: 4'-phosphopantetheinyl transferase superfamily protein [Clostridia bacterium]|nr:4'-phosphopantetheinyl transferase superfamily protein [Clostridia bacterium]
MSENTDVLVLYAPIREADMTKPLYPECRDKEVRASKSDKTKREKYLVWKLLEKAVEEQFNIEFANLEFTKCANGKWICPELCFSLSHSGDIVAAAVAKRPVGVDVQKFQAIREGLAERILTAGELGILDTLPPDKRDEFILSAWAGKESAFKRDGGECLAPRQRESKGVRVTHFEYNSEKYVLAVAASDADEKIEIRFTEEI